MEKENLPEHGIELYNSMTDIKLVHKPLFEDYFSRFQQVASEMTFTILFAWRDVRKIRFCELEGHLIVARIDYSGRLVFFEPVGQSPEIMIQQMIAKYPKIHFVRIRKDTVQKLPESIIHVPDRDNFDYIYLLEDLRKLAGGKYMQKRNFVNRMMYERPEIVPFTKERIQDCLALHNHWFEIRAENRNKMMIQEDIAAREVLANAEGLGMEGICIYVDGTLEAFALGARLSDDTFDDHFEKARETYKGIYQYLLNEFAKAINPKYIYLNRENDMGVENIRKSKESWKPVRMVEKYYINCEKP